MPEHPPIKPAQFKGDYHEYGLYLHNWYRRRHGAPPLKLAKWMNDSGDNYCYKLARNGGMLIHSSGLGYGENLYGGPQAEAWLKHVWPKSSENYMHKCAVREACEAWYNEVEHYNYGNGGFSMATGHFTAMVWKGSSELGIGVSWVGGTIIVAGCYKVHPNMSGHFSSNVLRYRDVADTDDEEEESEQQTKEVTKQEPKVDESNTNSVEEEGLLKDTEGEDQGKGCPDENAVVEEEKIPLEVRKDFDDVADSDGTIGWYELKDLLPRWDEVRENGITCDKALCRLMIKTITLRDGGTSERISFLAYQNIVNCIKESVSDFKKADKDGGGYLDPFEVKEAFSGGHDISYADVQGLMTAVGEANGKMNLYGFILAELLISCLSGSDLGIKEDDHAGLVKWMGKFVEFAKSSAPLAEWK